MSYRGPTNRKSEFLGLDYGTATNRLRKRVMFQLVQEAGKNTCFRCGGKIETVRDLSLEHKQEWLGVDPELFWSLDNIAFSHLGCNSGAKRTVNQYGEKKQCGEGQSWCCGCQCCLPVEDFYKGNRPDGTYAYCKKCKRERYHGRSGKPRAQGGYPAG